MLVLVGLERLLPEDAACFRFKANGGALTCFLIRAKKIYPALPNDWGAMPNARKRGLPFEIS